MGGVVSCNSVDVVRVEDAGGVLNQGGKDNGGEGGKKDDIYSSSCVLLVNEHKKAQHSSCTPSSHFMNQEP